MLWGLIPAWSKEPLAPWKTFNARSETVDQKPAFRQAAHRRRGLIPASGFYEWTGSKKNRQPYFFSRKDGGMLAMAGLWELWPGPEGQQTLSCTILTTTANELILKVHDRMPVIIPESAYDLWLAPEPAGFEAVRHLCHPYPADRMDAWPVSPYVNDPRSEGPRCVERIATLLGDQFFRIG